MDILRWHLHKQGYEVAAARDGAEALAMIAELRPDLVILDVMMPVLDGIDVARRIKSDESRREVTVVFCDLRGFTRLTVSSDPDEVMRVLREYHAGLGELITQYEGTLERFVGDGLLVVFNDPLPCPDHTERAVRMALDMRACVAGLAMDWRARDHNLGFRVGISRGTATLGSIGFERRAEYSVVGTVPNLAARLCEAAKAGQILVSRRVFSAVEQLVQATPVGDLTFKGLARPMAAYNLLRLSGSS